MVKMGMAEPEQTTSRSTRMRIPAILQFAIGVIVVGGGAALVALAVGAEGTGLGVGHMLLGVVAFPAAYTLWTGNVRARTFALALNVVIIAFSSVSEGLLVIAGSLPTGALYGSIGGTAIAIVIALVVIYQLRSLGGEFFHASSAQRFGREDKSSPEKME